MISEFFELFAAAVLIVITAAFVIVAAFFVDRTLDIWREKND